MGTKSLLWLQLLAAEKAGNPQRFFLPIDQNGLGVSTVIFWQAMDRLRVPRNYFPLNEPKEKIQTASLMSKVELLVLNQTLGRQ